jgi:hypothetical protein
VAIHWNGESPEIMAEEAPTVGPQGAVTEVTAPQRRNQYYRPCLPREWRRRALRASVDIRQAVYEAIVKAEERINEQPE